MSNDTLTTVAKASVALGLRPVAPSTVHDELFLQVARMYYAKYGTLPTAWRAYMEQVLRTK